MTGDGGRAMRSMHLLRLFSLVVVFSTMVCIPPLKAVVVDFDRFYPSYDDLVAFIDDISSPIVATSVIGSSDEASPRDIVALKISDNPELEEDEFGFLFVGVIHGDEPIGIRVILDLIETLTESYASDDVVRDWVDAYEIWIVPVINPYGYDNNWRKNGPNTGIANTSGVDLNRNFDFRWDQTGETNPDSDTFRGPSAASEPEVLAIGNLVLGQRPAFGITFHSGRGGLVGEIMFPWNRFNPADPRPDPPDRNRIIAVANAIADAVQASRGGVDRPSIEDAGAEGQSNVYHHAVTGMFDYMLETTADSWADDFFFDVDMVDYTVDQQNRHADAEGYVQNYFDGVKGLLTYFLFDTDPDFAFRGPGITGHISDCMTGEPLAAKVKVLELDDIDGDGDVDEDDRDYDADGDPDLNFRTAEPLFGRYLRLLEAGTWTLEFSLAGYVPQTTVVNVVDNPAGVSLIELEVVLDPGTDNDGDGHTLCENDCNDGNPDVYPGAPELCDGIDNDCDAVVPPDEIDDDGDAWWECAGDCNDGDAAIYPGAPELCDGIDNDCDAVVPPGEIDDDGDSWRECEGDCDDGAAIVYPGAAELCDGLDNDCNTMVDDNVDVDGDGHIDAECGGDDCNDGNPDVYPGAPEQCDHVDNQCPGDIGFMVIDDGCADFSQINPPMGGLADESPTLEWTADGYNLFMVILRLPIRGVYWSIKLPWRSITVLDMSWLPNYSFVWCNITPGQPIYWWVVGVNTRTWQSKVIGPSVFFKAAAP